jgi:rhamnosyl/mannosyltransferase
MSLLINILHLYKDYYPVLGGIENTIKILAEGHVRAGHRVTVLACSPAPRTLLETRNGVDIIKAGRITTAASMPISLRQPLALARLDPDVIHVHSPYPLGELSAWLLKPRTPLVLTHHSDVVRQQGWLRIYGPLLRRVLRSADRIMATSPRYIESSPWLQAVQDKCVVVPLGVDHQRFSPPETPFAGPPTLLFVGQLRYYKGLDTLLRALVDLPDVHLKAAGSGPMRHAWEALAGDLAIAQRVRFLGRVPEADLPTVYQQAHLFVLPANARAEAFGMVLLEAMASGLPCISTELGTGTSWVVRDGQTGLVVPPKQPQALAQAIDRLLSDAELRQRMGQAGRARVEAEFTHQRMIDRVERVYQEVLSAPGRP